METPILLIHFNRPEATRRQLEALAGVAPSRVWVLCDGARVGREAEAGKVREVRALLSELPWDCELKICFREQNLGVSENISTGIRWFLEEAGAGIILEDDCLPSDSFFPYCTELLERYEDNESVFAISGHAGFGEDLQLEESYGFSNYFSCWGWATWARAWQHYDSEMLAFKDPSRWATICKQVFPKLRSRLYWRYILGGVASGKTDSWAYRYALSIWSQQGLGVFPRENLVENIGFNAGGTNTASLSGMEVARAQLDFPLTHPLSVLPNLEINRWLEDHYYSKSWSNRFAWLRSRMTSTG